MRVGRLPVFCLIMLLAVSFLATCDDSKGSGGSRLAIPTDGLVAYYPFSGNAKDASGNGNDGTLESGAAMTADRNDNPDSAVSNNSGGYVTVPDDDSLDLQSFTISAWFSLQTVTDAYNCIIGKGYDTAYSIGFESGGSGDCPAPEGTVRRMRVYNTDNVIQITGSDFSCNSWYHVAATYDYSTGNVDLYVNGSHLGSATLPAGLGSGNEENLGIGHDGGAGDRFNGVIDEVCIYNRVLTADEVQILYEH